MARTQAAKFLDEATSIRSLLLALPLALLLALLIGLAKFLNEATSIRFYYGKKNYLLS